MEEITGKPLIPTKPESGPGFGRIIRWVAAIAWALAFPAAADGGSFFWLFVGAGLLTLIPLMIDKAAMEKSGRAGFGKAFRNSQERSVQRVFGTIEALQVLLILAMCVPMFWWLRAEYDVIRPVVQILYGSGTKYLITPNFMIAAVPMMAVLIGIASIIATLLATPIAGKHLGAWREYNRLRGLYMTKDGEIREAGPLFLRKFFIASLVSVILFLGIYMRVSGSGIGVRHWWNVGEKSYGWDSVRKIVKVQWEGRGENKGKWFYKYRITFADGSTWRSEDSSFPETTAVVDPAVHFIAMRSGKQVRTSYLSTINHQP